MGGDYIIDPFFRKIVTAGADGVFQTPVPGYAPLALEDDLPTTISDDVVRPFASIGRITAYDRTNRAVVLVDTGGINLTSLCWIPTT